MLSVISLVLISEEPMFRSPPIGVLAIGGVVLATLGCRNAGNVIPAFKWAAPSNRVPAEAPVAMSDQPPEPTSSQLSAPIAGSTAGNEVSPNAASAKDDPLHGFYPEDLPESTNSTSGFVSSGYSSVPRTGSFPSNSSAGCTSGCCPQ